MSVLSKHHGGCYHIVISLPTDWECVSNDTVSLVVNSLMRNIGSTPRLGSLLPIDRLEGKSSEVSVLVVTHENEVVCNVLADPSAGSKAGVHTKPHEGYCP